ncbi:hypothetical protein ASPZODRAFT_131793 [Penicilliopsis zonata CBS 506.65]|uniref:Uncharacterized protein n=1 Tax=Penicilliopsis zonata CBS 506.65 TaxID=1073090 RepID=A0A1L9SI34_9EURO|nr:hypothetical protein ASPZODRAFT_131793 [Penicilliopsis zonata CBS 506.65]OJJ46890.1 hypothetical protein ASPZODRAFT_131793 [Penicilliopsis zonata CBS 506.65]
MSFLAGLCGCFTSSTPKPPQPTPGMIQTPNASVLVGYAGSPEGMIRRIATFDNGGSDVSSSSPGDGDDDGYAPVVPLPRYTPRPVSIHEKTLAAHMRDPPVSSEDYPADEKGGNEYNYQEHLSRAREDTTSDVSSAISFPSSYGNTSTATRDTPPPPYSPRGASPVPSRSMSISSVVGGVIPPPPMAHLAQPCPLARRAGLLDRDSRRSIDSRHSWEGT